MKAIKQVVFLVISIVLIVPALVLAVPIAIGMMAWTIAEHVPTLLHDKLR